MKSTTLQNLNTSLQPIHETELTDVEGGSPVAVALAVGFAAGTAYGAMMAMAGHETYKNKQPLGRTLAASAVEQLQ